MHFRQVQRQETFEPYAELWNREYPDDRRLPSEIASNYLLLTPECFEEHWIGEEDEKVVAIVSVFDPFGRPQPDHVICDLIATSEQETQTLPAVLAKSEEILGRSGASSLSVWTSDRQRERLRILASNGYQLIQTVPVTRLDIQTFDPGPFAKRMEAVREQGIRLTTIQQLQDDGVDWVPELYEATWEMVQDMPQTHEPVQPSFTQYREMLKDRSVYHLDLMFVAVEGSRILAYSRVSPAEAMPELVRTGLSGTVRSHRRRGLVTAVKVSAIETLKQRGYKLLQTDNDDRNPMYTLNLELGFRNIWHWLQYEKKAS